ncbi:MAG: XdhC family protein [Candidatus Puniceispirillaceae bacterium]
MLDVALLRTARDWLTKKRLFVVVIVTNSWGSSPRQKGAIMLVSQQGEMAGSVSGGCVEAEVIDHSLACLSQNQMKALEFTVSDERAWSQGLSCGGTMTLLCLPVNEDFFSPSVIDKIASMADDRQSGVLEISSQGKADLQIKPRHDALASFTITPTRQLFIIGASHIAQSLAPMAIEAGYLVHIIDPRSDFLTKERFRKGHLLNGWPSDHLQADDLDSHSALVTLTHNPVIDDDALAIGLLSKAFYIAALGSRKTHAKRLARLGEAGHQHLDRLKGPAGFAIGAATPAEIAVSILAEMISYYRDDQKANK